MPDSTSRASGAPRRRSPEQATGLANNLFRSFTAPQPPADQPVSDAPELPAAEAGPIAAPEVAPIGPTPTGDSSVSEDAGTATAMERAPAARPAVEGPPAERALRPATTRRSGVRPPAAARTAVQTPEEGRARPPRPSRPRLVDPTVYATKHRNVQTARIQALLRGGDLDVLDEVARRTLDLTGEDTNRSELLRALVEGLDQAGVSDEFAKCGTHRQRVAFLAERLRG